MPEYDVEAVRARFPALARLGPTGEPVAWLDGPAGTQVPSDCMDAITGYLTNSDTNRHGAFAASEETEAMLADVRAGMAAFLGATDAAEIAFGPNMTTLAFALSRALGQAFEPGDELVVTRLDHDANVAPWLALARERGLGVRWVGIEPDDGTLRLDDLAAALGPRTRLIAVGLASNALGTINPISRIVRMARSVDALLIVDAVHAAPHLPIDVASLGADLVLCSAYKIYGPHLGVAWGRRELLESLPAYHVRPAGDAIPGRFETGTQAHELLAGLAGTLAHLEWVGTTWGAGAAAHAGSAGRRRRLTAAITAAAAHERELVWRLIDGLGAIAGTRIHGITDRQRADERCPTVSFTLDGHEPDTVAAHLAARGLHAWSGDFYAWELVRALGLAEAGGLVRVGIVGYNTAAEVDRVLTAIEDLGARA